MTQLPGSWNVGVNPVTARQVASRFSPEQIDRHIDVLDWLLKHGDRVPKNPAGYLVQSIREEYALPAGYIPRSSRTGPPGGQHAPATTSSRRRTDDGRNAIEMQVRTYLRQLAPVRRERLEVTALAAARSDSGRRLSKSHIGRGRLAGGRISTSHPGEVRDPTLGQAAIWPLTRVPEERA